MKPWMENKLGRIPIGILRNINDKTGLEPYNLHNIITFCMYHAEGLISVAKPWIVWNEKELHRQQANKAIEVCLALTMILQKGHTNIENEENDDQPTLKTLRLQSRDSRSFKFHLRNTNKWHPNDTTQGMSLPQKFRVGEWKWCKKRRARSWTCLTWGKKGKD